MDIGPDQLGTTVEKFGWAVVFLFLFVTTVWFLIRLLNDQIKERKEESAEMATIIAQSTSTMKELSDAIKQVKCSQDACAKQACELMIYIKAKEGRMKP